MQTIILSGLRSSQFCGEFTAVRSCRIMITEKEDVAGGFVAGLVWALLLMDPSAVRQMIIDNYGGVRVDGTNATIIGNARGVYCGPESYYPCVDGSCVLAVCDDKILY